MRMLILVATILITFKSIAAPSLSSSIINSMHKSSSEAREASKLPFVYGGQDISRSALATTHDSLWSAQPNFVG